MSRTSTPQGPLAFLLTMALLLAASSPAYANNASKILTACGGGRIPAGYSQQDYKSALKQMSPFLSEYTDCEELIHRAQLAAVGGGQRGTGVGSAGSSSGFGGGPGAPPAAVAPPTPTEQRSLEHAHHNGAGPVQVGDEVIHPGVVHANIASALSSLPTPLLVVLAFLLTCALLVAAWSLRRHVGTRRSD